MYQIILENIFQKYLPLNAGELAVYIPELKTVDPGLFALSVTLTSGEQFSVGNKDFLFTLQSTSKPFSYGLALKENGHHQVHAKVGVEPTGEAFNSIIELEKKTHRPFNPMINSGAIAIANLIQGKNETERELKILNHYSELAGRPLSINQNVFQSEKKTGHRNRAIAHLLRHFNVIGDDIEESLDLYFKQCSINVNVNDLSMMAATMANEGIHPLSKKVIYSSEISRDIIGLIFTCGMYDTAGDWAFHVGIPAKSGVSGAMFATIPGKMGIAVFSPLIDSHGHSVRGVQAMTEIAKELQLNLFNQRN